MTTVALLVGRDPAHRYSLHRGYADAVWRVGATPLVFVPPLDAAGVERYVDAVVGCDAVCATGGGDIDPRRYGEDPLAGLQDVDAGRDAAEVAAVVAAVDAHRPVLGICRGIQLLAVAFGGRLHQDLPTAGHPGHWQEERQHEPVHALATVPGSLAEAVLGGTAQVNSIHHQAVKDPGARLVATAWADDGVIEAVESDRVLGIQWHPERMAHLDERHLAPFRWLTGADNPVAA
ncbi:MAG: gamma-glutamyl-gamma-aminobutyrate hydrolase family protein [Acidimicrobiales bacterium]